MSNIYLYHDDAFKIMPQLPKESFDVIFVDPPYFLSNDGFTCQNGEKVLVNKGEWDKSLGFEQNILFHETWIKQAYRLLKPTGTLFVTGTYHSIYICGFLFLKLGWHILNDICWFKPNASPNLSGRMLTASHETILWVKKHKKAKHFFNYELMKEMSFPNDNLKKEQQQMRSVWSIAAVSKKEKQYGYHPTQKPLALLGRIILASTDENHTVLDPFMGSGTAGVICKKYNRSFYGIEKEDNFFQIAEQRISQTKGIL